jgi:hypothetical protein
VSEQVLGWEDFQSVQDKQPQDAKAFFERLQQIVNWGHKLASGPKN